MNKTTRIAGITFADNIKNVIQLRGTEDVVLKHEPLILPNGKEYPNCVNVYADVNGLFLKIGSIPEKTKEDRETQKNIVNLIKKNKQDIKGVISDIVKIKPTRTISSILEEIKNGSDTGLKILSSAIQEHEKIKGQEYFTDGDDFYIGGIEVTLNFVDENKFRVNPKNGVCYLRLTAFLSENTNFIHTEEELKRLEFWQKKFEIKDVYKTEEKKMERIDLVNSRITDDYYRPSISQLSQLDNLSIAIGNNYEEVDTSNIKIDCLSDDGGVLGVTAQLGTIIHKKFFDLLNQHTQDKQKIVDSCDEDSTFSNFIKNIAPYDIETEESDKGNDNVRFDDTLGISGEFDFRFKNGRSINLKKVVKKGKEFVLEPFTLPAGENVTADLKTGKNDGITKDGTYYEKAQKKHFLQIAFYGKQNNDKYGLIFYSGTPVGDDKFQAVIVDVEEWYEYLKMIKKGSRFDF